MKTTIKLLAVLALMLATFSQHMTASAGGGGGDGDYQFRGRSADAFFSSTDPSGCIFTDVGVFASEGVLHSQPGPAGAATFISLFISQYNVCTEEQLFAADGVSLADPDFQVDKKLNSATLNTMVNVQDALTGNTFDVDINLAWTATDPATRQRENSHFGSPGCKLHVRFNGTSRPAEASGSVSNGVTNFALSPSIVASISSTRTGAVVIGCN